MTYYATFLANHSTRSAKPFEGTNKKELIRSIRKIAEGETFYRGDCSWCVQSEDGGIVASGGLLNGIRYRSF